MENAAAVEERAVDWEPGTLDSSPTSVKKWPGTLERSLCLLRNLFSDVLMKATLPSFQIRRCPKHFFWFSGSYFTGSPWQLSQPLASCLLKSYFSMFWLWHLWVVRSSGMEIVLYVWCKDLFLFSFCEHQCFLPLKQPKPDVFSGEVEARS